MTIIIPCSLGNSYCTFSFLIIDERNILYYNLYTLTEKSLKHLCSITAWVPMSVFLSLSPADSLERRALSCSLFCSGFQDSLKKAPCAFTPPREGAWCLREKPKSCVKDFIGFLHKPGSISLYHFQPLSLSYHCLRTTRSWSIKGPQQIPDHLTCLLCSGHRNL